MLDRMTGEELGRRFSYHSPKEDQPEKYAMLRDHGYTLATIIARLCPESREVELALTHLEQAVMWANAAIARRE